jgi:hypothetical protein
MRWAPGLLALYILTSALLPALLPAPLHAQDLREAQQLFERGVTLADAERWGEAAEYFRRARAIVERPSIVCNLGVALHHLSEASEATEALLRCQELARADPSWGAANAALVARTERLLSDLRPAVGRLTLSLEPRDATVTIDGEVRDGIGSPRELELDPGTHHLGVSAPGFVSHSEDVSILSGAAEPRTITLARLPTRPAILVVESVEGARIYLDGVEIGVGHAERALSPSVYRIHIEAEGHDDLEREVTLTEGERRTVDATFGTTNTDLASEPALWVGVGAGVVAIAIAITLGVVLSQPTDPLAGYGGTTDVTLMPLVSF